jgi:glycine/D-amino acid oxidase-like deaminating enzyme
MKIALIGSGFAGLACCWHILGRLPQAQCTIFSDRPLEKTASGVSAGLLHRFAGMHAKKNWQADAAFAAAERLLGAVGTEGMTHFKQPILRLPVNERQREAFAELVATENTVSWAGNLSWLPEEKKAIWIEDGYSVLSLPYLQALKKHCLEKGALCVEKRVTSLDELANFDKIVIAAGMGVKDFFPDLILNPTKGQLLTLERPKEWVLASPLNRKSYLIPSEHTLLAGATYEHHFASEEPDVEVAKAEILPSLIEILPILQKAKILSCKAGVRASTPNHRPILLHPSERCFVVGALGSKGLLYHAWLGEQLAQQLDS